MALGWTNESDYGKIVKILSYSLKGSTENMNDCIEAWENVNDPMEIFEQTNMNSLNIFENRTTYQTHQWQICENHRTTKENQRDTKGNQQKQTKKFKDNQGNKNK